MGFGIIETNNKKMNLIELNELKLSKIKDHYLRLKLIFERTIDLIDYILIRPRFSIFQ